MSIRKFYYLAKFRVGFEMSLKLEQNDLRVVRHMLVAYPHTVLVRHEAADMSIGTTRLDPSLPRSDRNMSGADGSMAIRSVFPKSLSRQTNEAFDPD